MSRQTFDDRYTHSPGLVNRLEATPLLFPKMAHVLACLRDFRLS